MPRGDAHLVGLGVGPAVLRNGEISPERKFPGRRRRVLIGRDKLTRRNQRLQDSVEQEARRSAGLGGVRVC